MRALVLACALLCAFPLGAAIPGVTPKTFAPDQAIYPRYVAADSSGKVWFTDERYTPHFVGYFDAAGKVTKYPVPCAKCATGEEIVYIYGLLPSGGGVSFLYSHSKSDGSPIGSYVGRIAADGSFSSYQVPTARAWQFFVNPSGHADLAMGSDGNLWFTENAAGKIGKMTPAGAFTEYPLPSASASPSGITAGPDGNLWFTETSRGRIGRITTAGVLTEFTISGTSYPYAIVAAPDGNLWFTAVEGSIGRVTTAGAITVYPLTTPNTFPQQLKVGPDNNLWFTLGGAKQVARATVSTTGGAPLIETTPAVQYPFDLAFRRCATTTTNGVSAMDDGQRFDLYVTVHDDSFNDGVEAYDVSVQQPCPDLALRVLTSTWPFYEGVPLPPAFTFEAAGNPPLSFTIVSGRLPAGASLAPIDEQTAEVVGTPSEHGTFEFTIEVKDSSGCTASKHIVMTVYPAACAKMSVVSILPDNNALPAALLNATYLAELQVLDGVPPFQFTAEDLPRGLSIARDTGTISGMPLESGSSYIYVFTTDSRGCFAKSMFKLSVIEHESSRHRAVGLVPNPP